MDVLGQHSTPPKGYRLSPFHPLLSALPRSQKKWEPGGGFISQKRRTVRNIEGNIGEWHAGTLENPEYPNPDPVLDRNIVIPIGWEVAWQSF
jgi:hypothetical protein